MTRGDKPLLVREAAEAPDRIANLLADDTGALRSAASLIREASPRFAVTVARGSSDHAASFAAYVMATRCGLVVASVAPSVVTLYDARLRWQSALVLAISQSGVSPDIVAVAKAARAGDALVIGLINAPHSPLAAVVSHVIPLLAGRELAVAATKTFVASVAAVIDLSQRLSPDPELGRAIARLPEALAASTRTDHQAAVAMFAGAARMLVVARGRSLPIAHEVALKLKEVCAMQAESLSAAELMHGPIAMVGAAYPVLVIAVDDETLAGILSTIEALKRIGARICVISDAPAAVALADCAIVLPPRLHPVVAPCAVAQAAYGFVADLALARSIDPDRPVHLRKVTETF